MNSTVHLKRGRLADRNPVHIICGRICVASRCVVYAESVRIRCVQLFPRVDLGSTWREFEMCRPRKNDIKRYTGGFHAFWRYGKFHVSIGSSGAITKQKKKVLGSPSDQFLEFTLRFSVGTTFHANEEEVPSFVEAPDTQFCAHQARLTKKIPESAGRWP